MEVVGGVAAVTELLSLSIRLSRAAKNLTQSFRNSPNELLELSSKIDLLFSRLHQYENLYSELSAADSSALLLDEHHTIFLGQLQSQLLRLQSLKAANEAQLQDTPKVKDRLLWATLNKTKADRVIREIKEAVAGVDNMLNILGLPAIVQAFKRGLSDAVSTLSAHGGDLLSAGPALAGLLHNRGGRNPGQLLRWKVKFLRSLGFSDWNASDSRANPYPVNLLYSACECKNLEETLFALEVAGVDPNIEGSFRRTALGNAGVIGWVEGASLLVQCGAEINGGVGSYFGTLLVRSLNPRTQISHWFLQQGADPQLTDSNGLSAWAKFMRCRYIDHLTGRYGSQIGPWSYPWVEGGLAHLLMHDSDPFELFMEHASDYHLTVDTTYLHWDEQIRAADVAQRLSTGIPIGSNMISPGDYQATGLSDDPKLLRRFTFTWSNSGDFYGMLIDLNRSFPNLITIAITSIFYMSALTLTQSDLARSLHSESLAEDDDGHGEDDYDEEEEEDDDDDYVDEREEQGDEEGKYFFNATRFFQHTSTEEGRAQLSSFPMVRALCDALQYAGYRAEMDNDGDIWFEDEDGERYFDAWEYLPPLDEWNHYKWLTANCRVCQRMEWHGLGDVVREAEEGRRHLHEYREKLKAVKGR
ncbi:uncharacterized protein E0L32_001655 [Thyridium curvatum]|uniref:Uncharacterized protein n=1 Tax=Thyridium curvatum TaxID=1093900 RepID=A0A507AH32_9PEZI|nr:uncharacterized protein E0L32_001543 [Thyridium curvatum]XP_030990906.1 uncharacterized protein E0L32_001655 [Thyridium curvatum]TPX09083.1 hypothetical protein E0L32_001543 [Thyridium curvatum]TPX09195.1 hypothetical protein E0L32_001655 [Thyridium curvatum]